MAPRILVLASRPPFPLIGPSARIYHAAQYLRSYYDVDLAYLNEGVADEAIVSALEQVFARVHAFHFPRWRYRWNALRGLASEVPIQVHYYRFPELTRWLHANVGQYQAVVANHIRMADYLQHAGVPTLVDLHDAISLNYARALPLLRGARRLLYAIEQPRVLRYELALLRQFSHVFVVSEVDRAFLIDHGAAAGVLRTVPIALQERVLAAPPVADERSAVVFLGKMNTYANEDAACFFAREVFPRVRARRPDLEFWIVGADPSARVQALAALPGVRVTGYVEDASAYLQQALVVVAPIRFGAGLQNKVLEAMALGKAVVTTAIAAGPFGAADGEHVLVAEDAAACAAATLALIDDPARRQALGARAARLVRERFTIAAMGEQFRQAIEALLAGGRAG